MRRKMWLERWGNGKVEMILADSGMRYQHVFTRKEFARLKKLVNAIPARV